MLFAKSALTASLMSSNIEYDTNGAAMFRVRDQAEMDAIMNSIDVDAETMALHNGFPHQFWTKHTARGQNAGWGVEAGWERIVMKSKHGKWASMDNMNGGGMKANRGTPGPWEKFSVHWLGGQVAIEGANRRFMVCEGNGDLKMNRVNVGPWEKF